MKTKQRIIDATERIIQLKGLARVTTKEIAREDEQLVSNLLDALSQDLL